MPDGLLICRSITEAFNVASSPVVTPQCRDRRDNCATPRTPHIARTRAESASADRGTRRNLRAPLPADGYKSLASIMKANGDGWLQEGCPRVTQDRTLINTHEA